MISMERPMLAGIIMLLAFAILYGCASQGQAPPNGNAALGNATAGTANITGGVNLKAKAGDTVAVDYLGTLDNGTVFDTSLRDEAVKANLTLRPSYSPLEFTVGAGQMIPGFDKAVVGMAVGEEKTVRLAAADAYGERRSDLIVTLPLSNAPSGIVKGSHVMAQNGMPGLVTNVSNGSATVDFNPELAGQALTFKIFMRNITPG